MKNLSLFLILILFTSCGYEPVYQDQGNISLNINKIEFAGDKYLNRIIERRINQFPVNNSENAFNLSISSTLEDKINNKDKKGNPTSYLTSINISLKIHNDKETFEKIFKENFIYNHNENIFEQNQYRKNLIQSNANKILNDILKFLIEISRKN